MKLALRRLSVEQPVRTYAAIAITVTIVLADTWYEALIAPLLGVLGNFAARRAVSMDKLRRISPTIAGKIADGTFKRV